MTKKIETAAHKNLYEGLVICKPILDIDSVDNLVTTIEKSILAELDGDMVKVDKIGRKRLAYDMRKFRDGFMMVLYFNLPPQNMTEFNRLMHIQDDTQEPKA